MRPRFNSGPRRPKTTHAGGNPQKAFSPNKSQRFPRKPFHSSTQAQPQTANNGGQGNFTRPFSASTQAQPQTGNNGGQGIPTKPFPASTQAQPQTTPNNGGQGNPTKVFPKSEQMGNNTQGNPTNDFANPGQMQPQMGNNVQGNPTNPFPNSQMGNNSQGNPSNVFPNPGQMQPQMGMNMMNPQIGSLFNQPNIPFNNMSNRPPGNVLQQNGMPFMGGFMPGMNGILQPDQFFANNSMNLPQFFNPNPSLPNGQVCFQNPMQNMNQFAQMPMPGFAQVVPFNMPMFPNQVPQASGPQNPNLMANPQFGLMQYNAVMQAGNQMQNNLVRPAVDANGAGQAQNTSQSSQGNSAQLHSSSSAPPQQTQNAFRPPGFNMLQGNFGKHGGNNNSHPNWQNSPNKYGNDSQRDASSGGYMKNHNMLNGKGKSGFQNKRGGKGQRNDSGKNFQHTDSPNQVPVQQKRTLGWKYTKQEVQQWCGARRKNHPCRPNVEKKVEENMAEHDETAKLRRQQLKEILAKQAELGVEVAEIPSRYLSDSENEVQHHGKDETKKPRTKKERFQNKRGKSHQNDRFQKRQKRTAEGDNSSNDPPVTKRSPTLLQKLLSPEIKRDSSHLLQAFRFMVMNSFFKDMHEKPLRFPLVVVKETGFDGKTVERDDPSFSENIIVSEIKAIVHGSDELNANNVKDVHFGSCVNGGEAQEHEEEEEGEIID